MKMNVSTALKLIFSKMVIPCFTMSPWIRGTHLFLLSMIEEVKEHLQTSISVNFHTAVSHFYMDNFGYTFHSSAMYKSRIVSCWFSKTSSTICAVFKFSWSAGLRGAIIMMDANPLLNSLQPLHKWCSLSTPSPHTNINWQWISRVEIFCLYKPYHTTTFSAEFPLSLPLHINLSPKQHDQLVVAPSAAFYLYHSQHLLPQNKRLVKKNYSSMNLFCS